MDPLAHKVAERFASQVIAERLVNKDEIRKRIETIPGWQRSNFLQSLYRQVDRFPLSDKQVAVLEKIEREQAARAPRTPAVHADVTIGRWLESSAIKAIIDHFRKKNVVTVIDNQGAVGNNPKLLEHIVRELDTDFFGQAEMYAENNADEDDPERRERNSIYNHSYEKAGYEMQHAKIHVKMDGPLTTLTLVPSYQEIAKKHAVGHHALI